MTSRVTLNDLNSLHGYSVRYFVKGTLLRTENAAKPFSHRSKSVTDYLRALPKVDTLLDFGCGKLRYSDLLSRIGRQVSFLDSHLQLTRQQTVRGRMGTVTDTVRRLYPHAEVIPAEEITKCTRKYSLVTCTNVLSAIPDAQALVDVIRSIRRLTKPTGMAVFVNQHKNSYFRNFERGTPHLFGHLVEGKQGSSYYGVMTKERVIDLLLESGMGILEAWNCGEINFVEARPLRLRSPVSPLRRQKRRSPSRLKKASRSRHVAA